MSIFWLGFKEGWKSPTYLDSGWTFDEMDDNLDFDRGVNLGQRVKNFLCWRGWKNDHDLLEASKKYPEMTTLENWFFAYIVLNLFTIPFSHMTQPDAWWVNTPGYHWYMIAKVGFAVLFGIAWLRIKILQKIYWQGRYRGPRV